jgi:hypothetical protein
VNAARRPLFDNVTRLGQHGVNFTEFLLYQQHLTLQHLDVSFTSFQPPPPPLSTADYPFHHRGKTIIFHSGYFVIQSIWQTPKQAVYIQLDFNQCLSD